MTPAVASPSGDEGDAKAQDLTFNEYMRAHPGDWEGAAALVEELDGSVAIKANGRTVTPQEAAVLSRSMVDPPVPVVPHRGGAGGTGVLDWPVNAFTVLVALIYSPGDPGGPPDARDPSMNVYGEWDWQDDFIGQGSPEDIAAIRVNKSCGTWSNYYGAAATWNGPTFSDRVTLRSGGTGTAGPIWNVHDRVTNFENLTDRGMIWADYDIASCPSDVKDSMQAEVVFEGNDGGSVLNVSIGWGLFDVSYANPGFSQTRSSGAASPGGTSGVGADW